MSKRPKLTADELEELRDADIATVVGNRPSLVRLAELGLLRHWKGRYGWIGTITHAGREFLTGKPHVTPEALVEGRTPPPVTAPKPAPSAPKQEPAAKPRRVAAPAREPSRVVAPPKPASGVAKAAGHHRRAARVLIGAKYYYYPVSAFESLNYADKQIVETIHPFYAARSVAASASDHQVRDVSSPSPRSVRSRNR